MIENFKKGKSLNGALKSDLGKTVSTINTLFVEGVEVGAGLFHCDDELPSVYYLKEPDLLVAYLNDDVYNKRGEAPWSVKLVRDIKQLKVASEARFKIKAEDIINDPEVQARLGI